MANVLTIQKRVGRLENLMAQLIRTVDKVDEQLAETARQLAETDRQLARTARQSERTEKNLELLSREMQDFKVEMQDFKREARKEWGELSNKLGTMAEDLVAPSIERILRDTVGCGKDDVEYVAVRVKRRHPETRQHREFDVAAVCREYLLINETKSRLKPSDIDDFANTQLPAVRGYFPEFADKNVIGAIASLYVDRSLVSYGERRGLIVLGFGEDVMDVLNSPGFVPKSF